MKMELLTPMQLHIWCKVKTNAKVAKLTINERSIFLLHEIATIERVPNK